jgi:hypothetical protein
LGFILQLRAVGPSFSVQIIDTATQKNTIRKKKRHISSCSVECYQEDGKKGEMKGTGHVGTK